MLVKTYPGDVTALHDLSFDVPQGTVFGLLGPNGAGKSTTIKILTTLTLPTGGAATVAGIDVLRRPNDVRRAIGVVTQRHGTDPQATGRENLVLSGRIYGMRKRDAQLTGGRAARPASTLTEAADRIVRTYSGGMQRKLDVAMGLVHRPQVLFLDEPTTGLDPEARAQMWAEIRRLTADEGLTILLTTHYLDEADQLAERLAIVDRGRSSPRARRTSSRASCTAMPSWPSWRRTPTSRRHSVSSPSSQAPAEVDRRGPHRPRSRRRRRRRGARGARRARRGRPARRPPSPSPGRRWTTSTSSTPAAPSRPPRPNQRRRRRDNRL